MRARILADWGRSKKLATAWIFSRTGGWSRAEYQCGYCKEHRLHEKRVCKKHFPHLVQIGKKPAWVPRVRRGDKSVTVRGYGGAECPTSYITPESVWILEMADTHGLAHRDAGGTLFGPDTRRWPAWWLDALVAIAGAKNDYERAEVEAMNN